MSRPLQALAVAAVGACIAALPGGAQEASVRRLTTDGAYKQDPCWSRDGKRLLFAQQKPGRIRVMLRQEDGTTQPLTDGPPQFQASWHPDGTKIAYIFVTQSGTDGDLNIRRMNADGSNAEVLIEGKKAFQQSPSWSPDGTKLLYTATRDGKQDIWVAAADGSEPKRLTDDPELDQRPCWSPDGKQIAFNSNREGTQDIFVMNVDGSEVRRLTENPALDLYPAWSHDGKRIAFTSNRDGNYEIYVMNADGSKPRNITRHEAFDHSPAWHPDGKRLTVVSTRAAGYDLYEISP